MDDRDDISRLSRLKKRANRLPLLPGVYIMKNKNDEIIYIGKAKALKNRVTQYFGGGSGHTAKVRKMVSNVDHFEYIVCDSEFEALILENSLIKQNQPKYNILLKDDKGYSYVKITNDKWKKITFSRSADKRGEYIGPYSSLYVVKETVDEARKIFKLPDCGRSFDKPSKPCLNYHIGICDAPCRGKMSLGSYLENVNAAVDFIKHGGADSETEAELNKKMLAAAERLDFETAAKLRDRINAMKRIREKQKVVRATYKSEDVIASALLGETAAVSVFIFRNYRLCDKQVFLFDGISDRESLYEEFLQRYYLEKEDIPSRVLIDSSADFSAPERWLTEKSGHNVSFINPKLGEQKALLDMCLNNAAETLSQRAERTGREMSVLDELARLLGLPSAPRYIEAYDISNTAGSENVAGMIVYKDGRPFKPAYKRFKIKSFLGQDDFRSMAEVLDRRFTEYEKGEDEGFAVLPDLILLDGGLGQMSAVRPVLEKHGITVPLFGMVKDSKHRTRAIAAEGGDISIKSNRAAFTFITGIQDEVHRFAIGYHKLRRSKSMLSSELTEIEGIGKARAAALLKHFKTVKAIKSAVADELAAAPGMTKAAADAVYKHFHEEL